MIWIQSKMSTGEDLECILKKLNPKKIAINISPQKVLSLYDNNHIVILTNYDKWWSIIIPYLNKVECFIGYNLKEQLKHLSRNGFLNWKNETIQLQDIYLQEIIIRGETNKSMEYKWNISFLAKRYCNIQECNDNEVQYLFQICDIQLLIASKENLDNIIKLENNVLKPLIEMELNGIKIDIKKRDEYIQELETLLGTLYNTIYYQIKEVAPNYINPILLREINTYNKIRTNYIFKLAKCEQDLSTAITHEQTNLILQKEENILKKIRNKDIKYRKDYPYDNMVLKLSSSTQVLHFLTKYIDDSLEGCGKGKLKPLINMYYSFNNVEIIDNTIKRILLRLELVKNIRDYRIADKALSTLKTQILNYTHTNQKIYCEFNQILDTGRLSTSKPNIQATPKDANFRKMFIAEEGCVLIVSDYSQIELKVLAAYTLDPIMLQAFMNNEDLHKKIVSIVTGKAIEQVTEKERTLGKAINFGLVYGQKDAGLQKYVNENYGLNITFEEAKAYRNAYLNTYSCVKAWQNKIEEETKQLKEYTCYTILGRKRVIKKDYIYNTALNLPIQGSSADMLKLVLVQLFHTIIQNHLPWKLICNIHDEILIQCPESDSYECAQLLSRTMEEIGNNMLTDSQGKLLVRVTADPFKCKNWFDKDVKDSKGNKMNLVVFSEP